MQHHRRLQTVHDHLLSSPAASNPTSFAKCLIANRGEIAIRECAFPRVPRGETHAGSIARATPTPTFRHHRKLTIR